MICVLEIDEGEIVGWIMGKDIDELGRKVNAAGYKELSDYLYETDTLPPGKHYAPTDHIILVE